MRILGVDYGLKRIGIAIGETDVRMAFPRQPILSKGALEQDAEQIIAYARGEHCDSILLGLPLHTAGVETEQSRIVRDLGRLIERHGLDVHFWDERYSTSAAHAKLAHIKPRKRKRFLDSEAARQLVAEYLASLDA